MKKLPFLTDLQLLQDWKNLELSSDVWWITYLDRGCYLGGC
jgi:hypothetical protein